MKKIYFLFSFSLILFSASAQDFTCHDATLNMSGPANATLTATGTILNSGIQSYDLLCRISSSSMFPGHQKYFCFGDYCYDTSTVVSPFPTTLNVGESAILSADCIPNGNVGTSTVSYQIYDQSANSDTFALTFTYNFTSVGIADVNAVKYTLAQASPNPANNLTAINYSFASGKDARLVFHNLLGLQVKEIKLSTNQSTLLISVGEFSSGVYVYTLLIDGKAAASKKHVVVHR
jgi:hypothetical protein